MSQAELPATPSVTEITDTAAEAWPQLPTETEIYILPSGEVVVADLPAELAALVAQIGNIRSLAVDDAGK